MDHFRSRHSKGWRDSGRAYNASLQDLLLEVNIGREASKSGFPEEQIPEILARMEDFPACRVLGLMAIPPVCERPGENCRYFDKMRNLFVDINTKKYDNNLEPVLSMGMSADFEDAIRCGSTMVRLGTAIFGPRNYNV
mgnify:CR=1 FL=1